jgi:DNA repair protein RadC
MPDAETLRYQARIRDMPVDERPRERLRDDGASSLSNAELLAILLRTGTASQSALSLGNQLLVNFQGLGGLARASFGELQALHGLGEAKVAQVMAALELGKRIARMPAEERPGIGSPQDVYHLLSGEMALLEQESLRVLLLTTRNQVVRIVEVYRGTVNHVTVRAAEVVRQAVRENCPAIILAHNHPSGDPTPSTDDVEMTRQVAQAAKLLDVALLDHVIIGRQGFVSLKERHPDLF